MKFKRFPTGLVIPARPVVASRPPSGPDWVHEIKHDGYRLIVRRDGPVVRLHSHNAHGWTARLLAIASATEPDRGQELHDRRRGGRLGVWWLAALRRVAQQGGCRHRYGLRLRPHRA